ncbi:MAG: hypothetical protein AB8H47_11485 [Bacteroidia bacterium]
MKHYLICTLCLLASISLLGQEKAPVQRQLGLWGGIGAGQYINVTDNSRSPLGGRMMLWTVAANYDRRIKESNWLVRYQLGFSRRPQPAISSKFHYLSSSFSFLHRSKRDFLIGLGLQVSRVFVYVHEEYRDGYTLENNDFELAIPLLLEKQFVLNERLSLHATIKGDISATAIIPRFCTASPTNPTRSNCYHFFSESVFAGVGIKYDLGR